MARASCVYVVMPADGATFPHVPVATFTVKHELRSWLEKRPEPELLRLFRSPDGGRSTPGITEMSVQDVLDGK